jgi:VanZ family protein
MPFEPSDRRSRLPRVLLAAYLCALAYGSLYPWTGWRSAGDSGIAFLFEPWSRYWTWFDVLTNVAMYLPVGALAYAALRRRSGGLLGALLAILCGVAFSLAVETAQRYMPGRVPSRLDWLANSAGTLLGALLAAGFERLPPRFPRWPVRSTREVDGAVGLALVSAWLAIQMHPQRLLFGNGDVAEPAIRLWLGFVEPLFGSDSAGVAEPIAQHAKSLADTIRLDQDYSVLVEASGTAAAIVAIGMLVREIFSSGAPRTTITGALIAAAAIVRSASAALLLGANQTFAWLSAGAQGGVVVGAVALAMFSSGRRRTRLRVCAAAIALTALLTCLFPVDPYYESVLGHWDRGAWRNFTGLLEAATLLWPFVAVSWCALRLAALPREPRSIIRGR